MPIYEYRCQSCGNKTEAMQRVGDPPPGTCSECGGELRKLVSAPSFQFKGSGWYVTDYARKSEGKPEGKSEGKSEGKPEGKSEGKSEEKPSKDSKSETSTSTESTSKSTETAAKSTTNTSSSS